MAEAILLFGLTLAARERVLGADHARHAELTEQPGRRLPGRGPAAEAIPLLEQTLAVRERALGPDHCSTLGARNNLAVAYRDAGRASRGGAAVRADLDACERLLGADHPRTWRAANLTRALQEAEPWPWRRSARQPELSAQAEPGRCLQIGGLAGGDPRHGRWRSKRARADVRGREEPTASGPLGMLFEVVLAAQERLLGRRSSRYRRPPAPVSPAPDGRRARPGKLRGKWIAEPGDDSRPASHAVRPAWGIMDGAPRGGPAK